MSLRIHTLGSFCVYRGAAPISDSAWKVLKNKTLLKILLTFRRRALTHDQLIEWLWPDLAPDAASRDLRVAVSQLRKALEPDLPRGASSQFILTTEVGYAWNLQADYWLDAEEFDRTARSALLLAGALDTEALSRLEVIANLYRGDYLEEDRYADWATAERERLRETHLVLLTRLAEAYVLLRRYAEAVALYRRILAVEPCCESVWQQVMLAHFYAGDQAAAVRAYEECRQALQDEIGVEPMPATSGLYAQILARVVPAPPSVVPHNLPRYLSSFIGRQADLAEIAARLSDPASQLVALVGPGGVGKTRLAVQAAQQTIEQFPHGVYFVSLASVDSADDLVSAIADALRLTFTHRDDPRPRLRDYLGEKRLLLILDNFERLADQALFLVDLLRRAPQVHILVTSRQALNLQAAWTIAISGLAYPEEEGDADDIGPACDAVRLFVERASRVNRSFLSEPARPSIARICRLVDGIPLGIELAAAWAGRLSCQEIAQAIARDLDFLATTMQDVPPQHRSLRAVFEWSWGLLPADERLLLSRLSVFRGGFDRQAAGRVAGANEAVLTSLAARFLLHKSPLERYAMHELVRQYAAEKLAGSPREQTDVYSRHCAYYADFMHRHAGTLKGKQQLDRLNALRVEMDNVGAAWRWAVQQGRAADVDLALDGLYGFLESQSQFLEGLELFEMAAGRWRDQRDQQALYGRLLARQARFCERLGRCGQAQELGQISLDIATRLGLDGERSFSLFILGHLAYRQGKFAESHGYHAESCRLAEKIGDGQAVLRALFGLGLAAEAQGQYERAKEMFKECLALAKVAEEPVAAARASNYLGLIACALGEYAEAQAWCRSSLGLLQEMGDRQAAALALDYLGHASLALGETIEAAKLYQDSLAIRREIGDRWGIAAAYDNLGSAAFALGDYAAAERWCRDSLAMSQESQDRGGIARSLRHLAQIAYIQKAYQNARDLSQQALRLNQALGHPGGIVQSLCQLSAALSKLGVAQDARACLRQAFALARETGAPVYLLQVLVEAAGLLLHEDQPALAVTVATRAMEQPAASQETRGWATRVLAGAERRLTADALAAARAQGKALTIEDAVDAVLRAW